MDLESSGWRLAEPVPLQSLGWNRFPIPTPRRTPSRLTSLSYSPTFVGNPSQTHRPTQTPSLNDDHGYPQNRSLLQHQHLSQHQHRHQHLNQDRSLNLFLDLSRELGWTSLPRREPLLLPTNCLKLDRSLVFLSLAFLQHSVLSLGRRIHLARDRRRHRRGEPRCRNCPV